MKANYIEFKKKRTFSEVMNAIIEFTKRESKDLLKAQLYISGPVVLIAAILFAMLFDVFFTLGFTGDPEFFNFQTGVYMVGMLGASVLGQVFVTAVSLDYVYIYVNEKPDKITPEMVWKRSKNTLWGVLFHTIVLGILLIIGYVVVVGGFFALVSLVSPILFITFFIPFAVIFYFIGVFSLYFPIYVFEKRGLDLGTIIGRCFKLVKDNWWKTFGVVMISSIVVGVVSSIFFVPPYIVMITEVLSLEGGGSEEEIMNSLTRNWFIIGFFVLYVIARFLLAYLIFVGMSFQYYNLAETKEAAGLLETISAIDSEDTGSRLGADRAGDSEEGEDY